MTQGSGTIAAVKVATLQAPLPVPVVFGNWVMRHREFAICGVVAEDGTVGISFCYTRDGPIQALVERLIAAHYVGGDPSDPAALFDAAAWSNNAVLASGIGHRAVSLVDVATWDLAAKLRGETIEQMLGGAPRAHPATAIVGYPPTMDLAELGSRWQACSTRAGAASSCPSRRRTRRRSSVLRPCARSATSCGSASTRTGSSRRTDDAIDYIRTLEPFGLGWVEDIMPPGHAQAIATVRRAVDVPIGMGDEQGGAYHPEALLLADAVDVVRVDASTNGGITGLRRVLGELGGRRFTTHMFPHVHSRLFSGLGHRGDPDRVGHPRQRRRPGQRHASRARSSSTGWMQPLPADPGFGMRIDPEWLRAQSPDDPDNLIGDL